MAKPCYGKCDLDKFGNVDDKFWRKGMEQTSTEYWAQFNKIAASLGFPQVEPFEVFGSKVPEHGKRKRPRISND